MGRFYKSGGDVNWRDYGGEWTCRLPYQHGCEYIRVELTGDLWRDYPNMYSGEYHEARAGSYRYAVEVRKLDPAWYSDWPAKLKSALECYGLSEEKLTEISPWRRRQAEIAAAFDYGLGDVVDIEYSNNAYRLVREAKRRHANG